jgi:hypothetical protein
MLLCVAPYEAVFLKFISSFMSKIRCYILVTLGYLPLISLANKIFRTNMNITKIVNSENTASF